MSAGTGIGRSLPDTRVAAPDQPSGFLEWFRSFLAQELAPSPRRLRTTLRIALMTMLASGLGSSLQLPDSYAPLTTWRIFSTGSPALGFVELNLLTAVMITSEASSLVLAGILSEAPWLSLAFIFGVATTSTYVVQGLGLKSAWVMIQISFFATFFTIALTPAEAGTSTAYAFAGIALAYAITYLGDNFIWPEHVERDLLDSLGARIERNRRHLEVAGVGYFSLEAAARIKPPPLYTMLATHLALFSKVRKEQPDPRRREILLSAISQGEQIHHAAIVLGYLSQADVPRVMRLKLRDELEAVFAAFDVSLRDRATHTIAGLREGEGEAAQRAAWTRLTQALEALRNRTTEGMPDLAATSGAEASNLNSFVRELHRLGQILRRTPEELPPAATYAPPKRDEQMRLAASLGLPQDPQMVRHSVRTGIAVAVAFVVL